MRSLRESSDLRGAILLNVLQWWNHGRNNLIASRRSLDSVTDFNFLKEWPALGMTDGRPENMSEAVILKDRLCRVTPFAKKDRKLDVLTGIDPLKICVAYQVKGERIEEMPPGRRALDSAKPIYEEMPGWKEAITGARSISELPQNARLYIERLSELAQVPIAIVGVGASREATIVVTNPFRT